MRYTVVCLIFYMYICVMIENELTHIETIHTTHDIRDYYISMEKRIVMEKVQREHGNTGYYTHTFVEFFSNKSNPKSVIKKISDIQEKSN